MTSATKVPVVEAPEDEIAAGAGWLRPHRTGPLEQVFRDARAPRPHPDTHFSHKAWHDISDAIKKVGYTMIGDPTGTITRNFGVMIEEEGIALRGTFVINPEGQIKLCEIHDNSIGRDAGELLRKLKAAQYVANHLDIPPDAAASAARQVGCRTISPKTHC